MRRATVFIGAAVVVLFTAGVVAQSHDFSGSWTLDIQKMVAENPPQSAAGRSGGRGRGNTLPLTITMDAKTLKIETAAGQGGTAKTTSTYTIEEKNAPGRGAADGPHVAKWDGNKLVITVKGTSGAPDQVTSYYRDGDWLVVEREGQPGAPRTYYKKAS
jgi:hypothetical protein